MNKPRTRATFYPDTRDNRPECVAIIDGRELLIAALPALRSMEINNPDLLELYSGVAIVDRVKAALAFIDGVEPENEKS